MLGRADTLDINIKWGKECNIIIKVIKHKISLISDSRFSHSVEWTLSEKKRKTFTFIFESHALVTKADQSIKPIQLQSGKEIRFGLDLTEAVPCCLIKSWCPFM